MNVLGRGRSSAALVYLVVHTTKNRLLSRLRKARNPRYALAMILGGVYLWFVYLQPLWFRRPRTAPPTSVDTSGAMWTIIGTAFLLVMSAIAWFVDNGPSNLALDKAETAFILPAPVSRRALIGYKLIRAQIAILTTVVVWTILMRRGSATVSIPARAFGVWIFFTTTNLHRTGAEIVKAAWARRGGGALRRHWAATGVVIATIVGLAVSLGMGYYELLAAWRVGGRQFMQTLASVLSSGPSVVVLWPIHAVIGPMVAASDAAWLAALPGALIVLAVHALWLAKPDEEAVIAAVDRATSRADVVRERMDGRARLVKSVKPRPNVVLATWPLAPTGWPPMAIIWKNALCMRRRTRNGLAIFGLLAVLPSLAAATAWKSSDPAAAVVLWCLALAAELLFFGPGLLRNDLRSDMINLTALKLVPLSGQTIVAAEILSPVVPLAIAEGGLCVIAGAALLLMRQPPFTAAQTIAFVIAGIPALAAVTAAAIGIVNAAPVLFPAWTKLDALKTGGMEAMGQMIIVLILVVLLFVAMMLAPAVLVGAIIFVARSSPTLATIASLLTGALALALEMAALILLLGRVFERTEPAEIVA